MAGSFILVGQAQGRSERGVFDRPFTLPVLIIPAFPLSGLNTTTASGLRARLALPPKGAVIIAIPMSWTHLYVCVTLRLFQNMHPCTPPPAHPSHIPLTLTHIIPTSSGASSSLFFFSTPFPKKENQKIYAHQGLMGTVTDGANDMCPSRGSTLVLARLVTYAQSQGHQRSTQPPVSARDTPVTPLLRRHNDRDRP